MTQPSKQCPSNFIHTHGLDCFGAKNSMQLKNHLVLVNFCARNILNSMIFSFDDTKLSNPTFPLVKPTASRRSLELRNDDATQRMY